MSWIDDEANRAREDDDGRRLREQAFAQQAPRLCRDLTYQVEQDVAEINGNEGLRRRRVGSDGLKFRETDNGFEVSKIVFPAVYLRVSYHGKSISVERETVTYEQSVKGKSSRTRENISIELDDSSRPVLAKEDGTRLSVVEASRYLLTPSLNMPPG
jgi:hypothetical protein